MKKFLLFILSMVALCFACKRSGSNNGNSNVEPDGPIVLVDSTGWLWADSLRDDLSSAVAVAEMSEPMKLFFYGWGDDDDTTFQVQMPSGSFGKVILEYTMCGWNKGPADWDMTTEIRIKDKSTGEWYEFQRAFTPYGGSFSASWNKKFYMDVTHLLPILTQSGPAEFKVFYCGWDATETKAHAFSMKFYFFDGANRYGANILSCQKVYDSFLSGNNGYRAWAYGIDTASIEAPNRLGERSIVLPEGTKRALLRVCITGHGQEKSTVDNYKGYFPGRKKKPINPAEFDENWYKIKINGEVMPIVGHVWELNSKGKNYKQAGTYQYDRAGWGPGKPGNAQYWIIRDIPESREIKIDLDLDEYVSDRTKPNAEYVANYYVMADIFALDK